MKERSHFHFSCLSRALGFMGPSVIGTDEASAQQHRGHRAPRAGQG